MVNPFSKIVSFRSIPLAAFWVILFPFVGLLLFLLFALLLLLFCRCRSIRRSIYKNNSYWIFETFIRRIVIYLCQLCFCQIIVSHLFSECVFLVGWWLCSCRFMIGEKKVRNLCGRSISLVSNIILKWKTY